MSNENLLITTKLRRPAPRSKYIVRDQLFNHLRDVYLYKVIIIKGSAGSGKTTLLTSFIEKESVDFRWVTLDKENNDLFSFWYYVLESIRKDLGHQSEEIISLFKSVIQKEDLHKILTLVINQLDIDRDIVIVLDDFHNINSTELVETLDFFIKYTSDKIHFIFLTREETPMYFGDLIMEGKVLEIDEGLLRFTVEEGIDFLKNTLLIQTENSILVKINELAEGWVGGLQLLALALRNNKDILIQDIRVLNKYVVDYLSKEILEGLSQEEKDFLIRTSTLSYFNPYICNLALNIDNSQDIINKLIEKNIFIITIDEKQGLYRYHNIFNEFLKLQFSKSSEMLQSSIHHRSAKAYEDIGDLDESIRHIFEVGDYQGAVRLLEKIGQNPKGWKYLSKIPIKHLLHSRDLLFQRVFYHFCNMELDLCKSIVNDLASEIDNPQVLSVLQFAKIIIEGNSMDVNVISQDEIEQMNVSEVTKAIIYLKTSTFLGMQERYKEALQFIESAGNIEYKISNVFIKFFVLTLKAQVKEGIGDLVECERLYNELFNLIEEKKNLGILSENQYIAVTGVYTKMGEFDKAKRALDIAASLVRDRDEFMLDFGYLFNLMEYKILTGEAEEAKNILIQLFKFDKEKNYTYISYLLKYALYIGLYPEDAINIFENIYKSNILHRGILENRLLFASILKYKNEEETALQIADEILLISRKNGTKLKLIEASLLKITILQKDERKNKREILNLLREAIHYSYENSIMSPYIYFKVEVNSWLSTLINEKASELKLQEKIFISNVLKHTGYKTEERLLSDREREVLEELMTGASNKEIADRLCISIATVKTHIINIYSKLQVSNRVEAVEAGKKLIG